MFSTAVGSTTHFHDLKETKEVPHALRVAHDDDAVSDGFFNTEGRPMCVFGRRGDLRNQDGRASQRGEFLPQSEQDLMRIALSGIISVFGLKSVTKNEFYRLFLRVGLLAPLSRALQECFLHVCSVFYNVMLSGKL